MDEGIRAKNTRKAIRVASAYIQKDNKVLLLKRSQHNKHFVGYWQLPEGKFELGEEAEGTLRRELFEELSIRPASVEFYKMVKTNMTLKDHKIRVDRFVFRVTTEDKHIKLSGEHDDYQWVDPEAVDSLLLYPGTENILL